ncbi:MAG: hypothetical protein FGM18_01015 [Burkholderiaceae bacterium]|nr:hypothetical protein [Burkholderiaceae bacterium]
MAKSNDIKENFSALLRDSLRSRFGRIPSAAVVAREFNLRAYDTSPISQESARRWLRGVSLPEEERLRVLVNWLNLDFNEALKPRAQPFGSRPPIGSPVTANPRPVQHASTEEPDRTELQHHREVLSNGASPQDAELLQLLMALDGAQKRAMLELMKSGFRPSAFAPE